MSYFGQVRLIDTAGVAQGALMESGSLTIRDYLKAIAEGDVAGHVNFTKFGRCTASNSSIDLWEGNAAYVFPVAATTLDVTSSDNTNDKAGGTGALTVTIEGLDAAYNFITSTVTMNGTTIVTTASSFLRVNRMWVASAGSTGAAVGTISAKIHGGATVYAMISPGLSQSRQLIYTVPLGKTLYITSISFSSGVGNTTGNSKANYMIFTTRATVNPYTGLVSTIFYPYNEIGLENQSWWRELEVPTVIPSTADLKVSVAGDTALSVGCVAAIRGWIE
jgi:hypothetical protein